MPTKTISTLLLVLASALPIAADTATLIPDQDSNLIEAPGGLIANGIAPYLCTGHTIQGSDMNARRSLVRFPIDAQIPAGSVVTSVILSLYMSNTMSSTPRLTTLHPVTKAWGEANSLQSGCAGTVALDGDATWLYTSLVTANPAGSPAWTNPGGDFLSASASTSVGGSGFYTWNEPAMIADVQAWLDDPVTNHGWILIGVESGSATAKRFDARETGIASRRPTLSIIFTPPVVLTGACCFDDGTCSELSEADCLTDLGSYQGDGTSCSPNPCVAVIGACCLPDGNCVDATEADCTGFGGTFQGGGTACTPGLCPITLTPYIDPLPLPGIAQPVIGAAGSTATYEIALTEFAQQLHSQLPPTTVWGYAGQYPGPTIEAFQDMPVTVTWTNDLRDAQGDLRSSHYLPVDTCLHGPNMLGDTARTVVHLHGGHVPAEFDGYPEDTILPGESHTYIWPNNQRASTIWYHDHGLGITRLNVYMGLAGFYIIRDTEELFLDLPAGEFEVPLVIQDRSFEPGGALAYPAAWQEHFFGDFNLVNGKVTPYFEVKQGKYRFRILNGANSRTYRLSLSNGGTFSQIGTDGGLLPEPVALTELLLAPAERADVIIDFEGIPLGTTIELTNDAPAPFPFGMGNIVPEVMQFVVTAGPGDTGPVPATLTPIEVLDEADAIETRDFELRRFTEACAGNRWLINGLMWDDITEFPVLGTTEIWRFINRSGIDHPMHMHLVFFQVLDRQPFEIQMGQVVPTGPAVAPPPEEQGWKDTVRSRPFEITRVIARFEDYEGLFAYHCHILEHEDHEMMRQFQTVAPTTDWVRGDINQDGGLDIADAIGGLDYLFAGAPNSCEVALDSNDDEQVNIADPVSVLGFLFSGGPPPPAPFPACGVDPTPGSLVCDDHAACP